MRKLCHFGRFLLLAVQLIVSTSFASNHTSSIVEETHKKKSSKCLLVLHPTVENIQCIEKLQEMKILQLGEIEIIGIYHDKEIYNYEKSKQYIAENKIAQVHFEKIEGDLSKETIYRTNNCTKEFSHLFAEAAGFLFLGGPDIPAKYYFEEQSILTVVTDPYRHLMEISFLAHLLGTNRNENLIPFMEKRPTVPILGFCLGMQTMNVATGGTLIQDIPSELYDQTTAQQIISGSKETQHKNYHRNIEPEENYFYHSAHRIRLFKMEKYWTHLDIPENMTPYVLSAHHQAIKKKGQNFEIIATSMDGNIVEGIAHKYYENVIGFQFHPERSYLYEKEVFDYNEGETIEPMVYMKEHNSYNFHRKIWSHFSEQLRENL